MARRPVWKRIVDPINVSGWTSDVITAPFGGKAKTRLGKGIGGMFDDFTGITGYEGMADAQKGAMDLFRQMYEEGTERMEPFYETGARFAGEMPYHYRDLQNWAMESMPGRADPFYMRESPEITPYLATSAPRYSRFDPGSAPGYDPYQVGSGPAQDAFQVSRGPSGGVADVMAAPEQGAYQRREFDFEESPGYQWRKSEMETALDRLGSARGGRQGGRAFKEAARALGGLASEEFGAAHDRFMTEEDARQAAYESGAGRGLQAYGIEAPLRVGAQESAQDRAMSEWATREGLDLQGYEGAAGRGLDQFLTTEGMRQGESQFGGELGLRSYLGEQGMRQGESQFAGGLGLDAYATEQGIRQGAQESAQDRALQLYGMQMPYDWSSYQYQQEDPWRRHQAGYGIQQDYLSALTGITGSAQNAAAGMGAMGQQYGQQYGQGMVNLGQIGAQRSAAPWNTFMDVLQVGGQFAPYLFGKPGG